MFQRLRLFLGMDANKEPVEDVYDLVQSGTSTTVASLKNSPLSYVIMEALVSTDAGANYTTILRHNLSIDELILTRSIDSFAITGVYLETEVGVSKVEFRLEEGMINLDGVLVDDIVAANIEDAIEHVNDMGKLLMAYSSERLKYTRGTAPMLASLFKLKREELIFTRCLNLMIRRIDVNDMVELHDERGERISDYAVHHKGDKIEVSGVCAYGRLYINLRQTSNTLGLGVIFRNILGYDGLEIKSNYVLPSLNDWADKVTRSIVVNGRGNLVYDYASA